MAGYGIPGEEARRTNVYDQDAAETQKSRRIEKCPICRCLSMVAICWALWLKDHDNCGILVCIVCHHRADNHLTHTWHPTDWLAAA